MIPLLFSTDFLGVAQRAAVTQPIVSAVLRAKRGQAARLDPTFLYSNNLPELPDAVAAPADGSLVRAHLSGGNVQVNRQPAFGSYTTWATLAAALAPPAGFGVALSAMADKVAVAYVKGGASSTIQVQRSTNDGATWAGAETIANSGVITDVALAYAPNGTLVLVSGDTGGIIRAFASPSPGSWDAAVTLTPPSSAFVNSIALTYSGDWLALFSWADANQNYLASAIFGAGTLQAANTWSSVTDILGIAPGGAAAIPQVSGFAWGSDGGHAVLVEQWIVSGGFNGNQAFAMECNTTADFAAGYWTEPAPFPYTGANGADLASSQATAGRYIAGAEDLVASLAPPADVDISSRIISFVHESGQHSGTLTIALDNSDQAMSALATSRNTIGLRLDLSLGYQTSVGNLTWPQPQRWIVKAEASWIAGRYLVTLTAHDGWQLLHQLVSRRQAVFGPTLGLPVRTVDQIVHWLCAKAGITYTPPVATTLNQRTPNWTLLPEHSLGAAVTALLDSLEGWLFMTSSGATTLRLSAGDPSVYAFGPGAGQHPVLQVFHSEELQAANIVTVFAGATPGARPLTIGAIATDTGDAHLLGVTAHQHSDLWLEQANANAVALALLRKAQLSVPLHSFTSLPDVFQALGDVVSVTDPLTGGSSVGRVQTQTIHFNRDTSVWTHQTTLSAV